MGRNWKRGCRRVSFLHPRFCCCSDKEILLVQFAGKVIKYGNTFGAKEMECSMSDLKAEHSDEESSGILHVKQLSAAKKSLYLSESDKYSDSKVLMRKMGLEPTRCNHHKILSLARLPVPTLPHTGYLFFLPTRNNIPQFFPFGKYFFKFFILKKISKKLKKQLTNLHLYIIITHVAG